MFRALFASALLHLAILLSMGRTEFPGIVAATEKRGQAISLMLRLRGAPESHALTSLATPLPARKSRPSAPSLEKEPPKVDFSRFSPLTVASARPDRIRNSASVEEVASEQAVAAFEGVKEYRLNIARSARQFKKYPQLARESGWEGTVLVFILFSPMATNPVVSLGQSSGHAILDEQALEMAGRAVELAPLPDGVRGKEAKISLPVEYRLAN